MTHTAFGPNHYDIVTIHEDSAIDALKDGNIYIICSENDDFCKAMTTARNNLFTMIDTDMLLFDHNIEIIDNPARVIPEGNILMAVECGTNVIIPLSTPDALGKDYITAEMESDKIDFYLPDMIMKAERTSKEAIENAFMNLALCNPYACRIILSDVSFDNEPQNKVLFPYGCLFMLLNNDILNISPLNSQAASNISYHESREIFGRFVENCVTIKRASKRRKLSDDLKCRLETAKREVDFVFNTVWGVNKNNSGFRSFFLNQSDRKLKELYDNLLDRDRIAASSKLNVLIEESGEGIDRHTKNDGNYRVYISDGKKKTLVHFRHKPSCIVYMMYVLDICRRGNEVDTLDIEANEKLFCQLYSHVYSDESIGKSTFDNLFEPQIKGSTRKVRLTDCYADIRNTFEAAVSEYGENVSPFIIPNEKSHLAITSKNVSVPELFKNVDFSY